jgi:hypothetical protein
MKFFYAFLLSYCLLIYSQSELLLFNSPNIHQSAYTNLTGRSQYKCSITFIGFSGLYTGFTNTGFSIAKDLVDSIADNVWYLSPRFINNLKKKNVVYTGFNFDIFSIRVKWRTAYVTINLTDRFDFRFMYPKDLFAIVKDGNAQYIGKSAVFSDLRLNSSYYRELGFGITKPVNSKFEYGYRIKMLFGIANVHTTKSKTVLKIGRDQVEGNEFNLQSDIVLNTSYPQDPFESRNNLYQALTGIKNLGMGVDIGAKYNINKRLNVSLSANNIGFIRWSQNVTNQRLKGNVNFKGIEFKDISPSDSSKLNLNTLLDSLSEKFVFDSTHKAYFQSLVASTYLNFSYHVFRNTQINALLYADYFRKISPAVSLLIYQGLARWFGVNLAWNAQYNRYDNLGLGVFVKPGPLQIYVLADNLTPLIKVGGLRGEFDYEKLDFKNFNVRFGINLVFGRVKIEDAQAF